MIDPTFHKRSASGHIDWFTFASLRSNPFSGQPFCSRQHFPMSRFADRLLRALPRGSAAFAVAMHCRSDVTSDCDSEIPDSVPRQLLDLVQAGVSRQGALFDCTFSASKQQFDEARKWSWAQLGYSLELRCHEKRRRSTADTANRLRDKLRVESRWALHEFGHASCELLDVRGDLVAAGYEAIVYGDHGPYFELCEEQIHWPSFCHHKLKGPGRTHFEHFTHDESIKLYGQFQSVHNQPNPPPDNPFSCANNRPEGYADYRPGKFYISCDLFFEEGGRIRYIE